MAGGEGFHVFYEGLVITAKDFGREACTYESLMTDNGFGVPRGGNNAIDRMMSLMLMALGGAHNVTANVIDSHAWKLLQAHESYSTAESNIIAGILNRAYQEGVPPNASEVQPPNTVPKLEGYSFTPTPVSASRVASLNLPQVSGLRYIEYSTLGLGNSQMYFQGDPYIGGDLRGLSELATKLHTFAYQSGRVSGDGSVSPDGSVIANLNTSVRYLLKSSGQWRGPAATNFARAYSKDAANVHVLSDVAENSAQAICSLANKLYSLEVVIENAVRPLAEKGYRVMRSGEGLSAAPAPGRPGLVIDSYIEKLTSLYRRLHKQSQTARNDAAHRISLEYQNALEVLYYYKGDTEYRDVHANLSYYQKKTLDGYMTSLDQLQKSYKKTEKGLGLKWDSAGQSATKAAISAGGARPWTKWAGPIADIIFALIM